MNEFKAVVLAGSRPGGADLVADYAGVPHKALIRLGGATLLARVVSALRAAGAAEVAVSANAPEVLAEVAALHATSLPAGAGPSLSVGRALADLGAPLLVTTADHALLRPEWIAQFLRDAPAEADICALMARRQTVEADAPATRRTYLRLADGEWSGCNLFYLARPQAHGAVEFWRRLEAERKRPWRMASLIGPAALVAYLGGRLTLADALERLGRRAGVCAGVVESRFGLAAVDVDKPADLDLVRRLIDR